MGKKRRKKKKQLWKIFILLLLIAFARRYWDTADVLESAVQGPYAYLQGEWRGHGEEFEDTVLVIDADSICVIAGGEKLCDEEYSLNERTQLITSAYRQNFGSFALFEYREGEAGVNGKPLLVGNILLQDGGTQEVFFSKN